jgi:hypothetical protein
LVLFSIDRSDSLDKSAIIGRLFYYLVRGEIDFLMLRRLLSAVDKAFIDDLLLLPSYVKAPQGIKEYYPLKLNNLEGTGLTETVYPKNAINEIGNPPKVVVSELGKSYAAFLHGFDATKI